MDKVKSVLRNRVFIYVLLFLFSIFLASCCVDYDYDLYARFIVGENFFEKGVFNYRDFLSYTPTHPWYDHEYGASLVFYLFHKYLGAFGLVLIQATLMFLTAFFIIKTQQIQRHAYPVSVLLMAFFLFLFSHQNPNIVRCHMFSFVFFAMFLYFLEKTRISNLKNQTTKILWLVPLLTILWNNIHGGVVAGLGIIFIYMVGAIVTKQKWKQYFQVLVVSTPLLIINPYGPQYIEFLVSANTKTRTMITEWWDVFAPRHILYYFPLFFVGLFGIILKIFDFIDTKKVNVIKFLMLFVTLYMGTIHVKLLSLPIITLFALYHNDITRLFSRKKYKIMELLTYVCIFVAIVCIPFKKPMEYRTNFVKFPVKEVEFIKINDIKGNILTEFGLGSYVAYKLYPDNLIYMDGRYEEVYDDTVFDDLMNFEKKENDWEKAIRDYPTEIILLHRTSPIYATLEDYQGWTQIYQGDNCGVFVKNAKLKPHYTAPSDDEEYYKNSEFTNKGFFGKSEIKENNGR